eukprot:gb/GEZN01019014.1/.p2 GENE.gb/GEZN01019014.1/~~gb/GEZN01019014.1/.p2  ORF type:complete len:109 (+),score=3.13 gb/GEZN01019014.1/:339-665(+)
MSCYSFPHAFGQVQCIIYVHPLGTWGGIPSYGLFPITLAFNRASYGVLSRECTRPFPSLAYRLPLLLALATVVNPSSPPPSASGLSSPPPPPSFSSRGSLSLGPSSSF